MSCKASSEARVWEFPGLGAPLTDLQRTISSRFGVSGVLDPSFGTRVGLLEG